MFGCGLLCIFFIIFFCLSSVISTGTAHTQTSGAEIRFSEVLSGNQVSEETLLIPARVLDMPKACQVKFKFTQDYCQFGTLDVGLPLLLFYEYFDKEKMLLVASTQLINTVRPLPAYMVLYVVKECMKNTSIEATNKAKHKKSGERG
ncbi:hypothetical protein C8R44DRAFT_732916 [Mycena epipterygia]|nr:hypothetical protein C8R44DRAFT_732916 [Mycena epipterygia]